MTQKDKQLLWDAGLTFLLLVAAAFLLSAQIFWPYRIFLGIGGAAGFTAGWYNRNKAFEGIKYLTDAAVLIVLAWISYRVIKSTFLYKDVIAIMIQGVILLEIVFSFNFTGQGKTPYLRLLSVLVFMASPVFTDNYNIPLGLVYLLLWLLALRSQFSVFAQPVPEKSAARYYSLAASLACFAVAMLLAVLVSSNVYLGRIKEGQYLLDGESAETGTGGTRETDQEDAFYGLQEDLQNQATNMAMKFDSNERKRQLIRQLSELVKENLKPKEMEKAKIGLVDVLRRPGEGVEGVQKAVALTQKYTDLKNSRDIQKNKDEMTDLIKKSQLGIIDKIKITSLTNKVQQSSAYEKLQENSRELQKAIQAAPVNKETQQKLSESAADISDLKTLEFYRKKINDLLQKAQGLSGETQKRMNELISMIQHAETGEEFKQALSKINQLSNDPRMGAQAGVKEMLKNARQATEMKLNVFLPEEAEKIKQDAAQAPAPVQNEAENKPEQTEPENKNNPENQQEAVQKKKELKTIQIRPKSLEIAMGEGGNFTATGIYDDGSMADLTSQGQWNSLDKKIAGVSAGNVTSVSPGHTSTYLEFEGLRSEYASIVITGPRLVSLTLTPQNIKLPRNGKATLNVRGNYYDRSQQDLTASVTWVEQGKSVTVKIDKGALYPLRFGKTRVYAEYQEIRSNPASIEVIITFEWVLILLAKIILILAVLLSLAVAFLYWLREKKKQEILSIKDKPREFILSLYENGTRLTAIFGQPYAAHIPPLYYADLVQKKFAVPGEDFTGFAVKFEEAKYSRHAITNLQMLAAAGDYNYFFQKLISRQSGWQKLRLTGLTLIHRRPIFILDGQDPGKGKEPAK